MMKNFTPELLSLKDAGLYRRLVQSQAAGRFVERGGEIFVNLASNDYLGLSFQHRAAARVSGAHSSKTAGAMGAHSAPGRKQRSILLTGGFSCARLFCA
ncbi:MAG: hypothetical protein ACLUKN_00565 [Bacilli bacterium]